MTAQAIMGALKAHFPADAISWRVGSTNKRKFDQKQADKRKGLPLCYIDARDVMERLDKVMGADWQCEYMPMPNGTCCCRIGLKIDGEWRWRSNGAVNLADEGDRAEAKEMAEKGSYSDAFKRAAVLWGIGQYLYSIKANWIELDDYWGIRDADLPKLRALLVRNGAPAEQNGARQGEHSDDVRGPAPTVAERRSPGGSTPPSISERASAGVVDPKVAALNSRTAKRMHTRQDSQALFEGFKLALEKCGTEKQLKEWAGLYGSKSGAQDEMHDDHRAALLEIANAMRAKVKRAAA